MEYQKEEWKLAVVLKRGKGELTLQCDDQEFAHFCHSTKEFFDIKGNRMFRQVTDIGRYHNELKPLTSGFEEETKKAFERLKAGQIRLTFDPAALIRDFLQSRAWGDAKYLPLKTTTSTCLQLWFGSPKKRLTQRSVSTKYSPRPKGYGTRITEVLMKSFDPLNEPLKNYLRFADLNNKSIAELSRKVLNEPTINKDTFERLAKDGSVEGHIGLQCS